MKALLLLGGLLVGAGAVAPARGQQIAGKSISEYTTKMGTTIHVGDTLLFSRGGREDGSFKYSIIQPNILTPSGMPLPASWANQKAVVKSI